MLFIFISNFSDNCHISCQFLLLCLSLRIPYIRLRALFMLYRIQVFHSPKQVTLCRIVIVLHMRKPHTAVRRDVSEWTLENGVYYRN